MPLPPFLRKAIHHLPTPIRRALRRAKSLHTVRYFSPAGWEYHPLASAALRPGDCAIDAGANIGYISKLLADLVGPDGRVHAFEPIPETHTIHAAAMKALGLNQVLSHHAGISDRDGSASVSVPEYAEGGLNFYESHIVPEGGNISIRTLALDAFLADEPRPIRFIKIDVEGHELEAIQGAAALLQKHRPILLIEVQGNPAEPDNKAAKLFALLRSLDYSPYLWRGGNRIPWQPGFTAIDYVFFPASSEPAP